jgi:hypothetical protein
MASDTTACINLRLLINDKTGKILYAEAGKDFVDLLFSFLTLPIGSVMKLLSEFKRAKTVGSLTNLYNSVEKLQTMFMNADKSHLLEPNVMSTNPNDILRIQSAPIVYYVCGAQLNYGGSVHHMATQSGGRCACSRPMNYEVRLQNPSMENSTKSPGSTGSSGSVGIGGGYVKETVTFIITGELEISPASTITSINLLNKLNVKDLTDLAERNVSVGPNEAMELLWASLVSTTPLNDVFGVAVSASS